MNLYTTQNAMLKAAANIGDIMISTVPGVATAGALYGLSGYVPGLKKYRSLRLLTAALGGAGAMYGTHAYLQSKNDDLSRVNSRLAQTQHLLEDDRRYSREQNEKHIKEIQAMHQKLKDNDTKWQGRLTEQSNNWYNTINELQKTKDALRSSEYKADRAQTELDNTRLKLERAWGELDALKRRTM